ncbi:aspartate carbamoyltransferase catalytic subunit [Epilithonimonas arachidiradicis]|uniref:Aspartate carbamoyltransferase n=1 Tax=Epilithonimonas arachidiradicis TaxID=1617282 RepID=A0A420DBX6_9FLAO|nr:aspartate carbamoyltransferase catalytic subunit [Epilithonimonas arachidiradicis]RKE89066.1 aspartate carbamoyltransferase [Epilithonimonas arachidiradicis]GGG52813.1 aspartate carbamoyltransferase [Epilithonimonas arachidiradicis]
MIKLSRISTDSIEKILQEAQAFSEGKISKIAGDVFAANLFFENSTRTKTSFEVAEKKLGLQVIDFEADKSSIAKGETMLDTIKTLEAIGVEVAVIRHSETRYYDALKDTKLSIVNAGDGTGHHPTQAILDALTITQEFGKIEGLKIGIVGDVKHSRVANSDAGLFRRLGAKVYFSGPEFWFDEGMLVNGTYLQFDDLVKEVDVLILLRIQHERHERNFNFKSEDYLKKFGLTKEREAKMKPTSIIMHPAPINRGVEIDSELVECERSRIFKQMQNGVFARMAILKYDLENRGFKFIDSKN